MLIYDGIYQWQGWGGALRLGSGRCRLTIFDLKKGDPRGLTHLKPIIVIVTDVGDSKLSVRSCAGHIATGVAREFSIDPHRMLYVEHYPGSRYGEQQEHFIPEKFEAVDFVWHEDMAIQPRWRPLKSPLQDMIRELLAQAARPA